MKIVAVVGARPNFMKIAPLMWEIQGRAGASASLVHTGQHYDERMSKLKGLPNVHFLGRKPYADLPAYCKGFDVALMPFRINELTLNANPLKVREYLAAGLPVVSSAIPEVEKVGLCKLARSTSEFVAKVDECLREGAGPSLERAQKIFHESWDARVEDIRNHVGAALARRNAREMMGVERMEPSPT